MCERISRDTSATVDVTARFEDSNHCFQLNEALLFMTCFIFPSNFICSSVDAFFLSPFRLFGPRAGNIEHLCVPCQNISFEHERVRNIKKASIAFSSFSGRVIRSFLAVSTAEYDVLKRERTRWRK